MEAKIALATLYQRLIFRLTPGQARGRSSLPPAAPPSLPPTGLALGPKSLLVLPLPKQVPLRTRMGLTLAPAGGGIFVTVHKRAGVVA